MVQYQYKQVMYSNKELNHLCHLSYQMCLMRFIDYENEIKQKKKSTWRCLIMLVFMPFFFFLTFILLFHKLLWVFSFFFKVVFFEWPYLYLLCSQLHLRFARVSTDHVCSRASHGRLLPAVDLSRLFQVGFWFMLSFFEGISGCFVLKLLFFVIYNFFCVLKSVMVFGILKVFTLFISYISCLTECLWTLVGQWATLIL